MNFIQLESEQKLRGGFYTEPSIASYLIRWIEGCDVRSVLEPSCGDGVFLDVIERRGVLNLERLVACEVEGGEAKKAASRTALPARVLQTDFLKWYLFEGRSEPRFDAVVGNPPFIRYQYLADEQQFLAERIFAELGLPFTKHTNAWVPFVLASTKLLRPGGRIAMVIPSEILHIPHARSLRRYLADQCSRVLIIDPDEIWFSNTLQGVVLLLAEKKDEASMQGQGVAIVPARSRDVLDSDPEELFRSAKYTNGASLEGKWMSVFLSSQERELLLGAATRGGVKRFRDVASVDVGIVTGANKFFLVEDSMVERFGLQKWAHPMFGRSEHVQGLIYSNKDHDANKNRGLPANFLWFQEDQIEDLPANARSYLDLGLSQEIHARFKCRTRTPWYRVPSVSAAPVAMLKRAHNYPRLVLNVANAYTTDTAYRIRPLAVEAVSLVVSFVNSLTCLCAEMEGRHYGGGVLELVPSEIERLLVPTIEESREQLKLADERFRSSKDDVEFLLQQDAYVLDRMGLAKAERDLLHAAWLRFRNRRQRVSSVEPTGSLRSDKPRRTHHASLISMEKGASSSEVS